MKKVAYFLKKEHGGGFVTISWKTKEGSTTGIQYGVSKFVDVREQWKKGIDGIRRK